MNVAEGTSTNALLKNERANLGVGRKVGGGANNRRIHDAEGKSDLENEFELCRMSLSLRDLHEFSLPKIIGGFSSEKHPDFSDPFLPTVMETHIRSVSPLSLFPFSLALDSWATHTHSANS